MGKKTIFVHDVVTRNGDGARARVGGIGNERESRRGRGGSVRRTRIRGGPEGKRKRHDRWSTVAVAVAKRGVKTCRQGMGACASEGSDNKA